MRKLAPLSTLLFLGLGAAYAEEFTADIKKVVGNQITVSRFVPSKVKTELKKADVTLTAAEDCRVFRRSVKGKKVTDEPIERGLKNDMFKTAIVTARIFTAGDKVAAVEVLTTKPRNEFQAAITKVEGNKITVKKLGTFREQAVLTVADQVKVVHGIDKGKKIEAGEAIKEGLQNDLFATGRMRALLITNPDDVVTEIRVLPIPILPGHPKEAKPELKRIVDHGDLSGFSCVAFSPDGKQVVTGEFGHGAGEMFDGTTLRLWDVASGRQIWGGTFDERSDPVGMRSLAFSPDGTLVLAGSFGRGVHVYDAASGRKLSQSGAGGAGRDNIVLAVAFSPSRGEIVSALQNGNLALFDPLTNAGRSRPFAGTGQIAAVAFSADGQQALVAREDRTVKPKVDKDSESVAFRVHLWDVEKAKSIRAFEVTYLLPRNVAFSPDGKLVLMASANETVLVWDAASGDRLATLKGALAAFAPDGKHVATATRDHVVRLWDIASGKEIRRFEGHTGDLQALAFSPDGKLLLSAGDDRAARLWNVADGKQVRTFQRQVTPLFSTAVAANGTRLLVGGGDGVVRAWDLVGGQQSSTFKGHVGTGTRYASGAPNPIRAVALSPDGQQAITSIPAKTASLWNTADGKELLRLEHKLDPIQGIRGVTFTADGKEVATIGPHLQFWDTAGGKLLRTAPLADGSDALAVALSPDGTRLLRGTNYGLSVWDVAKAKRIHDLAVPGDGRTVHATAFSPDGKHGLTGGAQGTVRLWDLAGGKEIRKFTGHKSDVIAVAMSPDAKQVLTSSFDRTARLWDAATGAQVHTLAGHRSTVRSVAFVPGKERAITAGEDGTLRLWDTKTGAELCQLFSFADGSWAVIDAQGRFDGPDKGKVQWIYYRAGVDIVSLQQLHSRYHDPGLLAKYLGHNKAPLRDVKNWKDLGVFPAIAARAPKAGVTKMSIRLTNRGGGIGPVQVFVNAKECIADARPAKFDADAAKATLTVDLAGALRPDAVNRIRVVAWNKEGSLAHAGLELER